MTVLQIGPYPPPHGGIQTNLVAIRQYLLARQIKCHVINVTRYRKADADHVYYPKSWLQVLLLLFRLRYDVIHLHIGGSVTPRLLGLSLVCCLMPGAKSVLTFHSGGYLHSKGGRTARRWSIRGLVFRRFDRIITVNKKMVEMFQRFGVAEERIRLINPYSFPDTPPDIDLPEPLKSFVRSHKPTLITVGGLEVEYDIPLQIEALEIIRERSPNAGLIIIGSGSLEAEMRSKIASKQSGEHVLLCGDVPHPLTLRAIAESDLFLRTTHYDGDSISIREAQHFGVPVIATDNGMRPDGVDLVPASDLRALCCAIEHRLTHGGRQESTDDGDANLQEVLELYKGLLSEFNGGAFR
ncbi:MAG TPA: glycosyltransferase family 4 protein [Blastocatellia bacterium]|nr:glycosyltransferase family 4 protein [Blastocatellia bacterium]